MNISFNKPEYLFLLFVIPLIILLHILTMRASKRKAVKFANFEAIERVSGVRIISKNLTSLYLTIIIISFIIFSISGLTLHITKESSKFSFVVVIDASQSMTTSDIPPSRLEAAKKTAIQFIDSLPTPTKIGIISFSGVAYIERDLTTDAFVAKSAVRDISIKSISGTNILEAARTAINMLKDESAKAIILLSDGQINVDTTKDVIDYANKYDAVVHTMGIGTLEGGKNELFLSKLDEDALKALAYNTEGKYYRATSEQDISNYFSDIRKATKKQVSFELSSYLLILSVFLFVLNWLISMTRYRVLP